MNIKWIFLTILAVFMASVALSVSVINAKKAAEVDIVAINEAVKMIEQNGGHLVQEVSKTIDQPFTIIDNNGDVLYQSDSSLPANIYDAIKNRSIIVDLMQNERVAGKLIIHSGSADPIQDMKRQLKTVLLLTFGALALLCMVYVLLIHHKVFKPFNKLQSFAVHVARGNLDIPLEMNKNNPFGAFTESFDIMREELAAARQSEYEANRSKKELVATLSHDIKTPVASIKAVSELMLMRATDEKVIKQLNTINSKAEQIHLLVTDMFHATLEELQELKVTAAEESSAVLGEMIENVNYDNQISCEPIPDCIIIADKARLQQVLDNILSNSYKYAGTPVTIASRIHHAHLELHIMDYGEGINGDELPLLFNKYYRGNNAIGQNGSGLGLYISKYFMHNMQGDIECLNHDDGFTVILKIKLA